MAVGIEAYLVAIAAAVFTVLLLELRIFTRMIEAVPFAEDEDNDRASAYEAEAQKD
jgi:hypothetical protein